MLALAADAVNDGVAVLDMTPGGNFIRELRRIESLPGEVGDLLAAAADEVMMARPSHFETALALGGLYLVDEPMLGERPQRTIDRVQRDGWKLALKTLVQIFCRRMVGRFGQLAEDLQSLEGKPQPGMPAGFHEPGKLIVSVSHQLPFKKNSEERIITVSLAESRWITKICACPFRGGSEVVFEILRRSTNEAITGENGEDEKQKTDSRLTKRLQRRFAPTGGPLCSGIGGPV